VDSKTEVGSIASTRQHFDEVKRMLDLVEGQVARIVDALWDAYSKDVTIFIVGNGGSAANASHFGQDLVKGTMDVSSPKRRIRALPLTDNISFITALANDEGYETVFAEQLKSLSRPGDVLFVISGSGNSPNVLRAAEYATAHGMATIGLTGFSGGTLGKISGLHANVPCNDMCLSEAVHSVMLHSVVLQLRDRLNA
jgi:D-sedoheptulose 7-phosphate isomerase